MANSTDTCQSLKNELASAQNQLNELVIQAQYVTDPAERRQLAQEMSNLRFEIRNLRRAVFLACQTPPPPPNVSITGVEITQATQYFDSLLTPCPDNPGQASCPDNSIPLVAGKTTVLRVYTDVPASHPVPIRSLTGVLQVRPAGSSVFPVALTPYNAPLPPRTRAQISRRNVNDTLNFRIPPELCTGNVEAQMVVYDPLHPEEAGFTSTSFTTILNFVQTATLKIRLVRIHYKNAARNMDVPPPTTADFWTTAQLTLKTYPIPGIDVLSDTVELYDGDFTSFFASGGPGAQGTTGTIFEILTNLMNAEGLAAHYLALIPPFPVNLTGAQGWAIGGRQIAENLNGAVMAQEIGHDSGFPHHAPGCGAPDPDPNYPNYDSYPSASIGEFGFDTVDSVVWDPAIIRDFMSYCLSPWISPYTYEGLFKTFQSALHVAVNPAAANQEVLSAAISISSNAKVTNFRPGFPGGASVPANGGATPYAVELHDENGNPLARERLRLTTPYQTLDDAQLDFFVALPVRPDARLLVVKRDEAVIHTEPIAKAAPLVELKSLPGAPARSGQLPLSWAASGVGKGTLRYHLRYSNDNGQTWLGLAANLTVTEYILDLDQLPGGENCLVQVLCTVDLRASIATSAPFRVPVKANILEILSLRNGDVVEAGKPVALFGFSRSSAGSGDFSGLNWSSSIDGFLGSGPQVVVPLLTAGRHRITLEGDDGLGGETSASIIVRVGALLTVAARKCAS
jgi:hypothetical protein